MTSSAISIVALHPPGTVWQMGGMISEQPWPREALENLRSLGASFNSPYTDAPIFSLPTQFDAAQRAVQMLCAMGLPPLFEYGTIQNPSLDNLSSIKWYGVKYPEIRGDFVADGMFENEWPCELPMPSYLVHAGGCSIGKRQLRKLQIGAIRKSFVADLVSVSTPFFSLPWQILVASSRLRDALVASDLKGFSFLPVAGADASAADRLLENGPCKSDSTDWFQWVIEGRAKPKPIDSFLPVVRVDGKRDCSICGRRTGDPQPSQLFVASMLDDAADVQVCSEFELPDGSRMINVYGELFASNRFVEFCVDRKFKGLSSLTGRAPSFTAMYMGPGL